MKLINAHSGDIFRRLAHNTNHGVFQSEDAIPLYLNNLQHDNDYRTLCLTLTDLPRKISSSLYGGIFYKSHLTSVTHLSAHLLSVDSLHIPSVSRFGIASNSALENLGDGLLATC